MEGSTLRIFQIVCTSEFAGVERSLTYVAPELARRGHQVTVFGGDPQRMQAPLEAAGVEFHPAAGVGAGIREVAASRGAKPDIVHSHMTAADIAAVATRALVRAPLVSTLHFAQPRGHTATRRAVYQALPPCFSAQIAISSFVASTCGTTTIVVPNGVPERVAPAETRAPVVLVAQRLESEKQTDVALRAWSRCELAAAGWELHVAGRGSEETRLAGLARELGVEGSVRFLGFVDDVRGLMARASVLLATAPGEPFGLSVVEAMAGGLPVVAADGGAHREVLAGFDGQLFTPGHAAACATTLQRMGTDPDLRAAAAERSRARYEEQYTIEHHVDRLLAVYGRVART